MEESSLISEGSSPSVYTASSKQSPQDYEIEGWYRQSLIDRLEDKLSGFSTGDISIGNYMLGNGFARDYLSYLRDGGNMNIEGFYRYVWNPSNKLLPDDHEQLSGSI